MITKREIIDNLARKTEQNLVFLPEDKPVLVGIKNNLIYYQNHWNDHLMFAQEIIFLQNKINQL